MGCILSTARSVFFLSSFSFAFHSSFSLALLPPTMTWLHCYQIDSCGRKAAAVPSTHVFTISSPLLLMREKTNDCLVLSTLFQHSLPQETPIWLPGPIAHSFVECEIGCHSLFGRIRPWCCRLHPSKVITSSLGRLNKMIGSLNSRTKMIQITCSPTKQHFGRFA